eukprot:1352829-Rhodomonas_salina.1
MEPVDFCEWLVRVCGVCASCAVIDGILRCDLNHIRSLEAMNGRLESCWKDSLTCGLWMDCLTCSRWTVCHVVDWRMTCSRWTLDVKQMQSLTCSRCSLCRVVDGLSDVRWTDACHAVNGVLTRSGLNLDVKRMESDARRWIDAWRVQ